MFYFYYIFRIYFHLDVNKNGFHIYFYCHYYFVINKYFLHFFMNFCYPKTYKRQPSFYVFCIYVLLLFISLTKNW